MITPAEQIKAAAPELTDAQCNAIGINLLMDMEEIFGDFESDEPLLSVCEFIAMTEGE